MAQENYNEVDAILCQRCQVFDIQAFSRNTIPWRGYRISDIANSAALGCLFCSYLARELDYAGFQIYTKGRNDGRKTRWVHFKVLRVVRDSDSQLGPDGAGLDITHLQIFDQNRDYIGDTNLTPLVEFHVIADPSDPASTSGDVVGRYTTRDARSQETIDDIKSWIATCVEKHKSCSLTMSGRRITTPTSLPTRCLEVTADSTATGGICIRLVETIGLAGSYTTLSHRWPIPPKEMEGATSSANLADRLAGKETLESRLPRHLVDACMLTFRLGLKYIWIDAVCIIQGTSDPAARADWAFEAGRMASYFQNSTLTVAATYGNDTTGLFSAEIPENSRPLIRLPYRPRPGSIATQPSFFYLIPSDRYANKAYYDHVTCSELLTRGWVFQEWVLSRRILCYTPTSHYFLCMEKFPHNEDGGIMSARRYGEGEAAGDKGFVLQLKRYGSYNPELKNLDILDRQANPVYLWFDIVEAYSKRSLTRPETDKLMALVGIADEFGLVLVRQMGFPETKMRTWVGGLWIAHMPMCLLWEQVGHSGSVLTASPNWNDAGRIMDIPSWSWASRMAGVKWTEHEYKFPGWSAACEVTAVRNAKAGQPDVATTPLTSEGTEDDWDSLPIIDHDSNPDQARLVDPTNTFPVLCLRARLISILIREAFLDEEERKVAAVLSAHNEPGHWRKVALSSSQGRICGWVSLDREQHQSQTGAIREPWGHVAANYDEVADAVRDRTYRGLPALIPRPAGQHQVLPREETSNQGVQEQQDTRQRAMHESGLGSREAQVILVSTKNGVTGGYPLGYRSNHHTVYNVLCLRRYQEGASASDSRFERIGVGRLFGWDVQQLFKDTEAQELQLL